MFNSLGSNAMNPEFEFMIALAGIGAIIGLALFVL
jgi:hypothetical protein